MPVTTQHQPEQPESAVQENSTENTTGKKLSFVTLHMICESPELQPCIDCGLQLVLFFRRFHKECILYLQNAEHKNYFFKKHTNAIIFS